MSSVNQNVRGRFISALQDLVPGLAIPPHQIAAVTHPEGHTKTLAKRKPPKRVPARKINDRLTGRAH